MDEEQAYLLIRNAIRLENLSADLAATVTPDIRRAIRYVQAQIRALPSEAIGREIRYRQLLVQLQELFRTTNTNLYTSLVEGITEEIPVQSRWADTYVGTGNFAPIQVTFQAQDSRVLGQRLTTLFGWEELAPSPFMKTQLKRIDRIVKTGFLLGETNDQIAKNLAAATRGSIADSRAIARTAVMDMSQRAHNEVWSRRDLQDRQWRYDATFDYRVCLECAPWDGEIRDKRSALPQPPIHPNCRCRVLPYFGDPLGPQVFVEIDEGAPPSGPEVRVYKTPVRIDGQRYTKVARDTRQTTIGGFLKETNRETRVQVLGVWRNRQFEQLVMRQGGPRRNANDVLRELIKQRPPRGK